MNFIPNTHHRSWTRYDSFALAALILVAFGLYFRTHGFDFVGYDDQLYVSENPWLTHGITLQTLHWALTAITASNYWHPLTLLTELFVASIFGTSADAFHVLNTLLHAANVGLLFIFLRLGTGRFWPAIFTAALWGFHPLRVESVAWVAELKDVLCGFLWLLCMLAYIRYSRHRVLNRYVLVVTTFLLAMLAKPMAMTLPFVLLLLDYWPLQNIETATLPRTWWMHRLLEKVPLVLLSLGPIAYSALAQVATATPPPLSMRIENALTSIIAYLSDSFYPSHLAVFYPHPAELIDGSIPAAKMIFAASLLLTITGAVVVRARTMPYLAVGWCWFIGVLAPVIGLIQNGEQSRADRYTYLPAIGLTMAVVWFVDDVSSRRLVTRQIAGIAAVIAAIALSISAGIYVGYWRNTTTLFTHADEAVPKNYLAKAILAFECHTTGDTQKALLFSEQAVRLSEISPYPRLARGYALLDAGRLEEAAATLSMPSMSAQGWYTLGLVHAAQAEDSRRLKSSSETDYRTRACNNFRSALKENPDFAAAEDQFAEQTAKMQHLRQAIKIWTDLIGRSPAYGPAHGHLGDAFRLTGDVSGEMHEYRVALDCGERNASWETNLADLVATSASSSPRDIALLTAVATDARDKTKGKDPAALDALAACFARSGRFDDAIAAATSAVQLAERQNNTRMAEHIRLRLLNYQHGQPCIDRSD